MHTDPMSKALLLSFLMLGATVILPPSLNAKESRDISIETVPVNEKERSPLDSPILWKNIYRQGPVAGFPMPWDMNDGERIALRRVRIVGNLRDSEVELKLVMSLWNMTEKEQTVNMAVPVMYEDLGTPVSPLMTEMWSKGVNVVMDGERQHLMERSRITATKTTVDGKDVNYKFSHEPHPQYEAPSLSYVKDVRDWILFPVEFKGNQELIVEVTLIFPYSQQITVENGRETISPASLKILQTSGMAWNDRLHWGGLSLNPQEMHYGQVNIVHPTGMKKWKKVEGIYEWPLDSSLISDKKCIEIEISPKVKLESSGGKVIVNAGGKSGTGDDRYNIKTSSTLEGCDPGQLKTGPGGWAEGVSGDGKNEWVELAFDSPRDLVGILLVNGRSPAYLGAEEQKHPELAFSFYGYARKIQVTLNDSYTFPVTLREDWNTQFIIPPYNKGKVRTIKIQLDTVQGGKMSEETWLSRLLPVVK